MILRTVSAVLLAFPLLVSAATYTTIDNEKSQIEFHYEQMGVNMSGNFTDISGQINFDSTQPEKAEANIEVKMASVDTGSDEADDEIVKKDWFNADSYPDAVFTTTKIEKKADDSFEVTGLLNIKGHEQEIQFPATVTEADDAVSFTGSFSLLRGDYAIGEGAWSKFDIVANDIRVDFTLIATE